MGDSRKPRRACLDLINNSSAQALQIGNHESLLPGAKRVEALLPLTSQALEGSLQCLADEYAKYELTIYFIFKKIVNSSLGEASLRLWEALESLLGRVEDLP
jgi:hypothetical protein